MTTLNTYLDRHDKPVVYAKMRSRHEISTTQEMAACTRSRTWDYRTAASDTEKKYRADV